MGMIIFWATVAIFVAAIVLAVARGAKEAERGGRLAQLTVPQGPVGIDAGRDALLGLKFRAVDPCLLDRYAYLSILRGRKEPEAINILEGLYCGHKVCAFDIRHMVRTGAHLPPGSYAQDTSFCDSALIVEHEGALPKLLVQRRRGLERRLHRFEWGTVKVGSPEFRKEYRVICGAKKFAEKVLHAEMQDHIMRNRLDLEFSGPAIATTFTQPLDETRLPSQLGELIEVRRLIPTDQLPAHKIDVDAAAEALDMAGLNEVEQAQKSEMQRLKEEYAKEKAERLARKKADREEIEYYKREAAKYAPVKARPPGVSLETEFRALRLELRDIDRWDIVERMRDAEMIGGSSSEIIGELGLCCEAILKEEPDLPPTARKKLENMIICCESRLS